MDSSLSAQPPGPSDAPRPDASASGACPSGSPLSDRDRRILALESRTFRYVGAKERRIREELGMTPLAYVVRLNALLDEPAALREAPALVHRLRARRTSSTGEEQYRERGDLDGGGRVA